MATTKAEAKNEGDRHRCQRDQPDWVRKVETGRADLVYVWDAVATTVA